MSFYSVLFNVYMSPNFYFITSPFSHYHREFGTALGLRVSPLTRNQRDWQERAQKLLDEWEADLWDRDDDITPVMYCAALIPGVWMKEESAVHA